MKKNEIKLKSFLKKINESNVNTSDIFNWISDFLNSVDYKKKLFSQKKHEKEMVVSIIKRISDQKELKEKPLFLLKNNFNLIWDHGKLCYATPSEAFDILRDYICKFDNFKKRFKKISSIFIEQYKQEYKNFKGFDNSGVGMEWTNANFSLRDKCFIDNVLKVALEKYYNNHPKKAFNFILNFCINYNEKKEKIKISKKQPDFLVRASINVILQEYSKENPEAKKILRSILKTPSLKKSYEDKLIFQEIEKGKVKLSSSQKWNLIEEQLMIKKYKNLPANVFVLQIMADLVDYKDEIFEKIKNFYKDKKFYKKFTSYEIVFSNIIERILKKENQKGFSLFKIFIKNYFLEEEIESFDAYQASKILGKALRQKKNQKESINLLKELSRPKKLDKKAQFLITGSLNLKDEKQSNKNEALSVVYNEFLKPLLIEELKKDLKRNYKKQKYGKIYNKFNSSGARENIVEFASSLARSGMVKEALDIIEIFINDPHPFWPNSKDPEDPNGEFNYHKKIKEGNDDPIIRTVRGWCGWTLLQCSRPEGGDFIKKMINIAKELIKDDNLLVVKYGAFALSGLARNRLAVWPNNKKKLFFGSDKKEALNNAKQVEKLAFEFLKKVKNLKEESPKSLSVMSSLIMKVFNHIRALNQEDAKKLIDSLYNLGSPVIEKTAALFIYFALFRSKHYKDWKWKEEGLYDDLEDFNPNYFQKMLDKSIRIDDNTRQSFASRFQSLVGEVEKFKKLEYFETFNISFKYLKKLIDRYDRETFFQVYMFINSNIKNNTKIKKEENNEKFKKCHNLWIKCLKKEKEYCENQEEDTLRSNFRFYYNNYEILEEVYKQKGFESFAKDLKIILSFPDNIPFIGIKNVTKILQKEPISNKKNKKIFNLLIKKYGQDFYLEEKKKWLNKKS
jgi:hypothetical protein